MNNRRSFIVGINSTKLSSKEKFFLKLYKPWGVILFTRNIKNINQTLSLTSSIRKIFNDKKYPILIDQEGGRVNRLKNIITFENLNSEFSIIDQTILEELIFYNPALEIGEYLLNLIDYSKNSINFFN